MSQYYITKKYQSPSKKILKNIYIKKSYEVLQYFHDLSWP